MDSQTTATDVNTSMNPQTYTATVEVPENGEYLVTVLPIEDGMGIMSGRAFPRLLAVNDVPLPTTQG